VISAVLDLPAPRIRMLFIFFGTMSFSTAGIGDTLENISLPQLAVQKG